MDRPTGDPYSLLLQGTGRQLGWREGMEWQEMLCKTEKCSFSEGNNLTEGILVPRCCGI